jgi:hypothetical protein
METKYQTDINTDYPKNTDIIKIPITKTDYLLYRQNSYTDTDYQILTNTDYTGTDYTDYLEYQY